MTRKNKKKRWIAGMLSVLMMVMSLASTAFAWGTEGAQCVSKEGEPYVGSDGNYYYASNPFTFIIYDEQGKIQTLTGESVAPRTNYYLRDSSGEHEVYCVEAGSPYVDDYTYTAANGNNSSYFRNLPMTAQFGIALTLLYGYSEGKTTPVAGTNNDDYAFATQILIWEFQQQIRVSPAERVSVNGVPADMQYLSLKGRPAEKCYDWILQQMASHYVVPSFTSRDQSKAPSYTMEYDNGTGLYQVTLTDTNNTLKDLKLSTKEVAVTRKGNEYTFSCSKHLTAPLMLTVQKEVGQVPSALMIWGTVGKQTMVSGASDPVAFHLNLQTEESGTAQIMKTSEDGKVEGVHFQIKGEGIQETVTTSKDGSISKELAPGIYEITELSGEHYVPQNVQRVTVVSGKTTTFSFHNELKKGTVQVMKTAEDGLTEGVTFHFYGKAASGIEVDVYAVTNAEGKAVFEEVPEGSGYVLEEVDTAERYVVPNSQTVTVEWGKVTEQTFHNTLKKWDATVMKSDKETGSPQGDAVLSGAIYGVYQGSQLIDTYTTDENGCFTTKSYVCGDDWNIREMTPSEGYLRDETIYPIGADAGSFTEEYNRIQLSVTEQVIMGKIALIKHSDDGSTGLETPEEGAVFEVYRKDAGSFDAAKETERDLLTCDENGHAETKAMPYGVYTVHQVSGWDGRELLKDFDVFIAEDGNVYRFLANNAAFASFLKVVKVDAETGKQIPHAGAAFQIYRPDGSLITQTFTYPEVTIVDTFYTNGEGYLITPEKLPFGKGYSLQEVTAPSGYVLDEEAVYFDVTKDTAYEESGITMIQITKENMPQKGILKIQKSGEVFISVTEKDGMNQPVYEEKGLAGASFEVYAAEDIKTPDGTLRFSKGDLVASLTTGEDGLAETDPLYLGTYEVKEVGAPFGYVLDDEVHTVTLSYVGQEIAVTEVSECFFNERQKAVITFDKEMEKDLLFGIGSNGEEQNVTFGLYADEDVVALDGSVIPKDSLIEVISVHENGAGIVSSDLPFGSYYLKEMTTDEHYKLSEERYPITFSYEGEQVEIVMKAVNDGKPIVNDLKTGTIEGRKVDEEGEGLAGALIGLFAGDEGTFEEAEALMTAISGEDGTFCFEKVPYGTWYVREIRQPDGYVLDETVYPVTIKEDGDVLEVAITNEKNTGSLKIVKTSSDGVVEGFTFTITSEVYEESFVTDEDGIILVTDLIAGEYTIHEVGDETSMLYERPEDVTVTVCKGEEVVVERFNEKIQSPETGDDTELAEMIALFVMGTVCAALAVLVYFGLKEDKDEEDKNV